MKLLILDGNSILNRAFYGIKLLTTKDGIYTNAIYGFLTTFQKLKEEINPDAVAIAFDMKAPTFRHKIYSNYKANRKGMPNELAGQMPILKELLTYLGYKIVECEGFEADDILGTLSRKCDKTGNECVIATGDRDSLQLVSPNVSVRITSTKFGKPYTTFYNEQTIKETYGVAPKQLIQIKAIQGDTSDNIPGVKGIGEKGANSLIKNFGDLNYIYNHINEIDIKENIRKKLLDDKNNAFMSLDLGTIRSDAPIDTDLNSYIPNNFDYKKAYKLMIKLEFFSLLEKFGLDKYSCEENLSANTDCELDKIKILKSFSEFLEKIINNKPVYLLYKLENQKSISLISFYNADYIYVGYLKELIKIDEFKRFLSNGKLKFIIHDYKSFYSFLKQFNLELKNIDFDTMLAAYLLNPSANSYDFLRICEEYSVNNPELKISDDFKDLINQTIMLAEVFNKLEEKIIKNDQTNLLKNIEIPLSKILSDMETYGFAADKKSILSYKELIDDKIFKLQQDIYNLAGSEFNINSPKQLGEILFQKMELPHAKKTKSGYSTSAQVLESLKFQHPIIQKILEYRTLSKLQSTYCESLLKVIGEDNRIHCIFKQTETRTGRLSSTEPNLQNIPVRTDVGREIRKFFHAKDGFVLVDADYSQIELRILAHISNDKNMINAFKNNQDIHTITAAQVFNMPIDMITHIMRTRAKAVNFGIIYGISAFSLAKDIGTTRKEAEKYIKDYLSHYRGVAEYMNNMKQFAKENGYVATLFGRRRYLPEIHSSNFNLRSFGERVAMNMPIQGTAADIIKIAMIKVYNRLKTDKTNSRLIMQVHDELIVEAPVDKSEKVCKILKEEMENAVSFSVPLTVDVHVGKTWFNAKE